MKKNLMLKANTKSYEHHSKCSLTPQGQGSGVLSKALKCAHLSSHLRPSSRVAAGHPVVILWYLSVAMRPLQRTKILQVMDFFILTVCCCRNLKMSSCCTKILNCQTVFLKYKVLFISISCICWCLVVIILRKCSFYDF